jgi:hypothetical protein
LILLGIAAVTKPASISLEGQMAREIFGFWVRRLAPPLERITQDRLIQIIRLRELEGREELSAEQWTVMALSLARRAGIDLG